MDMNTKLEKALNGGFFLTQRLLMWKNWSWVLDAQKICIWGMLGWDFSYMCSFIAVFAVTAADPHESSYACYYDSTRQTYLGDVFSVMWMEDSEKVWLLLWKLFYIVKFVGLVFRHSLWSKKNLTWRQCPSVRVPYYQWWHHQCH